MPISRWTAAACIGCGACVAACKNASAQLFVSAKISHLALLPQGKAERYDRVVTMIEQIDAGRLRQLLERRRMRSGLPEGDPDLQHRAHDARIRPRGADERANNGRRSYAIRPSRSNDTASTSPFGEHGLSRYASPSHSPCFSSNSKSLKPVKYKTFSAGSSRRSRCASSCPSMPGIRSSVSSRSNVPSLDAISEASSPLDADGDFVAGIQQDRLDELTNRLVVVDDEDTPAR